MTTRGPSFEAIHGEFHPKVLRYLTGLAGAQEAPDLAQVAMIKVHEHLAQFRGESSLSTWIYRIATNVAVDHMRRKPAMTAAIDVADDDVAEGVPEALRTASAETSAIRDEMNECLRDFIQRLPPNYRAVIALSDIEGFTDREIAEVTGSSVESVKIRLHRARLKLREALSAGCSIGHDEGNELACERRPPHSVR